jgi:hypothetical protein
MKRGMSVSGAALGGHVLVAVFYLATGAKLHDVESLLMFSLFFFGLFEGIAILFVLWLLSLVMRALRIPPLLAFPIGGPLIVGAVTMMLPQKPEYLAVGVMMAVCAFVAGVILAVWWREPEEAQAAGPAMSNVAWGALAIFGASTVGSLVVVALKHV